MVQVYGVDDTIKKLKTLEPELLKQARKDMLVQFVNIFQMKHR